MSNMDRRIGVVAIGRNEGGRLLDCLNSVAARDRAVVYVDSGSTDGSPDRAAALGARIVVLESGPFTAARGRQTGMQALLQALPDTEYVQFIDGDCTLDQVWLQRAVEELDNHTQIAAVCGRRREERTAESLWSRMIDVDWNIPPGDVPYFGGDSLCRIIAIQAVGGWDSSLIAGEEPDLSFRLQQAGYRIVRLPILQTTHDVAMSRFWQFWKRSKRGGYASLQVGWRHRKTQGGRAFMREAISGLCYGLVFPVAAVALGWLAWPLLLALIVLYGRVLVAMLKYARTRGCGWRDAWIYAWLTLVGKVAAGLGACKAISDLLRGDSTTLIEYKAPPH